MTDSVCWVDTRDDVELTEWLRAHPVDDDPREGKEIELGSSSWTSGLWICLLRDWAKQQGLKIEYPPMGWIVEQLSVNRSQMLAFLEAHGRGERDYTEAVRARLQERGDEGFVYKILADEY